MEANEPARAVERRRVPRVMWAAAALTCIACVILLYALYHHWAAPYQTKADLRIDRPVMMMCISLAMVASGVWVWRRYAGQRAFVGYVGGFMMVPAVLIMTLVMTGVLIYSRPLIAHSAYDAAATEYSAELARLIAPAPKLKDAKQAAVDAIESGEHAELRRALTLIRESIPVLEQDGNDIATLEQRGREMFDRRRVSRMRTDAYFGWRQPFRDLLKSWRETNDAAVARFRDLERQLLERLGDAPPA